MDSVLIPVFTLEQFQTVSVLTSPQSYLFTSATVRILFTLHQSLAQNLSDMWRSTLYIGAAQLLSVTEIIAPNHRSCARTEALSNMVSRLRKSYPV